MTAVEIVERAQLIKRPAMKPGDTVRVHVKVREGDKERIQVFEGIVIGMHRGGARASFTVRKVSFGQGVERIFPLHSPVIDKVDVVRTARVRRAKLYFLRDLKGKAARMKETTKKQPVSYRPRRRTGMADRPMVKVRAFRTLENALRRMGFVYVAGRRRSRPRLPGRSGRGGGGRARSRALHRPASAIPRRSPRSSAIASTSRSRASAVAWAVVGVEPDEIDRINIHQASLRAMQRAVLALAPLPDMRAGGRVPHSGSADGAARRHARRQRAARPSRRRRSWPR